MPQPRSIFEAMQNSARRGTDVVIVGAGVIGLSIAWHLARAGASVSIAEREGVGAGASGIQPGGVRQQWTTRINCELARESAAFYRDIATTLPSAANPTLEPCGYLFTADTTGELERLRRSVALQNSCGVPSEILTADEVGELVPGLHVNEIVGAAYCGEDGYFDKPQAVVEAFAAAASDAGVEILRRRVIGVTRGASTWNVSCADDVSLAPDHLVIAAGYDSPELVSGLGVDLPIAKEARYLFLSEPINDRLLEPLVVSTERSFAAKHLASGRVLASDLGARGDPEARREHWRRHIEKNIESLVPILQFVSFPLLLEGFYDVTPDHQPIIGSVPEWNGLWIAAGFSGHGFMLAPAVGRRVADAISDHSPLPSDFAYGRFEAGALVAEKQVV
jgi:sarcosine oxidase subunit beta